MDGASARSPLASRLRSLRRDRKSGALTQTQVAEALGISNQQVSNWENPKSGQIPSQERLAEYARLFAKQEHGSAEDGRITLPEVDELAPRERAAYEKLLNELSSLRREVSGRRADEVRGVPAPSGGAGFWVFGDGKPIVIIGSEQPSEVLASVPEADPHHPDYIHALRHADADAVFQLQAHLAVLNPDSTVRVLLPSEVVPARDLQGHVVIVGGSTLNSYVDWFVQEAGIEATASRTPSGVTNEAAAWWDRRFRIPRELVPPTELDEVDEDEHGREFAVFRAEFRGTVDVAQPGLSSSTSVRVGPGPSLYRDLAVIARQPNPVAPEATATLVYGLFGQGTYGASLTFTDPDAEVREANETYVGRRFRGEERFWLLVRVFCDRRLGLTTAPRLADPETLLLEWGDQLRPQGRADPMG